MPDPLTTVLSRKGEVILPKAVREQRHWGPGTRLVVESTLEGVLLKPAPVFPATRPDEVFGCLRHDGPPVSLDEMGEAVQAEISRRHGLGRY